MRETTPITPRATPSPTPIEAPVDKPPVAEGLEVTDLDVVDVVDVVEGSVVVAEDFSVDEEKLLKVAEVSVLLADALMFHPTMAMAPTVDELTVSVLVVTVQSELPSV